MLRTKELGKRFPRNERLLSRRDILRGDVLTAGIWLRLPNGSQAVTSRPYLGEKSPGPFYWPVIVAGVRYWTVVEGSKFE